jgi:signal transduction histidine kinase
MVHSHGVIVSDENGDPIKLVGATQDVTELKRTEEKLKATSEQLRALSERLRKAKEEEGLRIARELHDELGSALTSLKWGLLGIDKAKSQSGKAASNAREKIAEMVGLVDSTINTVRRISSELRPGVVDDLGLVSAIEWHAQQFQDNTGIVCRFESNIEDVDLNREQATTIFRIFQEAMTNILRHAQATKVNILIEEEEGEFVLEIKDNGRGITEGEKLGTQSLGLLGMRERAHSVSGTVEISGSAGTGTVLTVRLPIQTISDLKGRTESIEVTRTATSSPSRKERS